MNAIDQFNETYPILTVILAVMTFVVPLCIFVTIEGYFERKAFKKEYGMEYEEYYKKVFRIVE